MFIVQQIGYIQIGTKQRKKTFKKKRDIYERIFIPDEVLHYSKNKRKKHTSERRNVQLRPVVHQLHQAFHVPFRSRDVDGV